MAEAEIRRDIRGSASLWCQIGPILVAAGVPGGCEGRSRVQGLHERRKASSAGSKINPANLIPACNLCNSLVECEPALVRELTGTQLVVREGDAEWEELGSRRDRLI